MKIHKALIELLRDARYDLSTTARTEQLRAFRHIVGEHVYLGRTPNGLDMPRYVCIVKPIAVSRLYTCAGEHNQAVELVQIDIYSNNFDAYDRVTELADNLRLAFSSYIGQWMDEHVANVQIQRESLEAGNTQVGEDWEARYSMDWGVTFWQAVVGIT